MTSPPPTPRLRRATACSVLLALAAAPMRRSHAFLSIASKTTHHQHANKKLIGRQTLPPRSVPSGSRHRSFAPLLMGGGFGAAGGGNRATVDAPGSAEAKTALESSGGDLNRATSMVFQRRLERLQANDQELASMLRELSAAGQSSGCGDR